MTHCSILKKIGFIVSVFLLVFAPASAQDSTKVPGAWRVELEPAAFIGKGYSLMVSHTIEKSRSFSLGLYTFKINLPEKMETRVFENISDSTDILLKFELALVSRYKFNLPKRPGGPWVGTFIGWESFDITHPSMSKLTLSNWFVTPQAGYEFYFFRSLLYINPSLRFVYEMGKKSSNDLRPEHIKDFVFLPSVSFGLHF